MSFGQTLGKAFKTIRSRPQVAGFSALGVAGLAVVNPLGIGGDAQDRRIDAVQQTLSDQGTPLGELRKSTQNYELWDGGLIGVIGDRSYFLPRAAADEYLAHGGPDAMEMTPSAGIRTQFDVPMGVSCSSSKAE